jgi:DNA-binding MarR family transcriptional regulator
MEVEYVRGMHALSFQLKRAHLKAVAVGREALKFIGEPDMTPARFDLLYLIRRDALEDGNRREPLEVGTTQAWLVRHLGLHRSTVAELVRRLVEMGWIRKERSAFDARTWLIFLTKEGLERISSAMRGIFRKRILRQAYETIFRTKAPLAAPVMEAVRQIHAAVGLARRIARHFGDRSWVWYDYGHAPENAAMAVKLKW